jgi:hypothetical protein
MAPNCPVGIVCKVEQSGAQAGSQLLGTTFPRLGSVASYLKTKGRGLLPKDVFANERNQLDRAR